MLIKWNNENEKYSSMHENLSKVRKSRIPLHKSKYRQNKTYCLEIHPLVTLKEKQGNDHKSQNK